MDIVNFKIHKRRFGGNQAANLFAAECDYRENMETHFGDEDIERPVEAVGVEDLGAVFADLLQRPEAALGHGGVVSVQQLAQAGQQVRPVVELALK